MIAKISSCLTNILGLHQTRFSRFRITNPAHFGTGFVSQFTRTYLNCQGKMRIAHCGNRTGLVAYRRVWIANLKRLLCIWLKFNLHMFWSLKKLPTNTVSFRSAIIWISSKTKLLGNPSRMNVLRFIDLFLQLGKLNTFHHSMQIFLFIGRKPTTWPANNCLQIMVCSWLQIIFCSCTNETALFSFLRSLLREKWQIASLPEDIQ